MKMVSENSLANIYNSKILYYMNTQIITFNFSSKISEALSGRIEFWAYMKIQIYTTPKGRCNL